MRNFTFFLLFVTIVCSCNKELGPLDEDPVNNDTGELLPADARLVQIVQGTGDDDTVYNILYENGLPAKIALYEEDTLYISYDNNHFISNVKAKDGTSTYLKFDYTFSNAGLLKEINGYNFGASGRYTFEYDAGNRLTRKNYYTSASLGSAMFLWRYYTYTFNADGDIAEMKEFGSNDVQISTTTFSYSPNTFNYLKTFALVNMTNVLGCMDILNDNYYFNTHMIASSANNSQPIVASYQTDVSGLITTSVSATPDDIFTRNFFYQ